MEKPVFEQEQITRMYSPEEIDLRLQAKLGSIPLESVNEHRGTKREGHFESGDVPEPEPLTTEDLELVNKFLRNTVKRKKIPILVDEFTKAYHPEPKKEAIENYISGTWIASNQLTELSPEAKQDTLERLKRQPYHILQGLQRETYHRMWLADARRVAIGHVVRASKTNNPSDTDALVTASDAIENFGLCLSNESNGFTALNPNIRAPFIIENIGAWLVNHPEEIGKHTSLLEIVKLEQERRYRHYAKLYFASVKHFPNQLTSDELKSAAEYDKKIKRFRQWQVVTK